MSNPRYINFYTERGGIVQLEKAYSSSVWRGRGAAEGYWIKKESDGKFTLQIRDSAFSPTYVFRGNGFADSVNMRDGNRLTYTYDTSNRLTRVTHSSGRYISLSWASSLPTVVASITAPNQAVYRFEYYTAGTDFAGVDAPLLKKVIYPDGKGDTEYVHEEGTHATFGPYTNAHRLLQIRIGGAPVKTYTYSAFGSSSVATSSFVDGTGLYRYTYLRSYDQITREVINPHGKKTTYVVEGGRITGIAGVASANCPATFKSASYDANGMTEHTVNDRDIMTTYQYDGYGRKVRQVEAAGTPIQRVTRWVYDSEPTDPLRTDLLKQVIVEGVSETAYEYTTSNILGDAMFASISVRNLSQNGVSGQERITTYSYTSHYNGVVASVSEDGPVPGTDDRFIKRYNSSGDLIEVENFLGHKRVFSGHNGFGQPSRIVNENGDVYEYQYDARGRITVASAIVAGVAQTSRYAFDGAGRLATVTTPDNVSLTREYDVAGRVLREYQNEAGGTFAVKKYTYNNASQPTSVRVQRTTAVIGPAGTPTLSISSSSAGNYTVAWSGASGVENYVLEEKLNSGSWNSSNEGLSTSKAYSGKAAGTYTYRVTGCNAEGCTPVSVEKSIGVVYPPASAPVVTAPTADSDGAFTASWSSVSATTEYRLEQRKDGGAWVQVYSGTSLSQAMSGLTNGTYDYQARACNAGGCSAYSAIKTTLVTFPPTGVPTLTAPAADNDGAFAVSWTSVSAATRYVLQQRKDGGAWSTVYNSSGLSLAISGLTNGSYGYRVQACNVGGCAGFSAIKATLVTHPPGTPTVTAPTADNDGAFAVSWGSVSTATSYRLEQRKDGGTWSQIYSGTGLSHAMAGLVNGAYDYQALACNAGGCSTYSAIKTTVVTHPPGTPTVTAPTADNDGAFTVSWGSVSTATSYRLEQRKDGGIWSQIYSGTGLSKVMSGLTNGTYDYQARACNAGGCSAYSAIKTTVVTFPPTGVPTLTAPATDNDGAFTVSWTGVSAAARYELQQRKDSGTWSTVYNSSGLSKAVAGLINGNYAYQVRACNVGGCAAFSAIKATVVTHPPGTPTVTAPTADSDGAFTVSWGSVSTTTSYRLEQRKDAGTWIQVYSGIGLSKAVSGLANGSYGYRALACNAGGCSAYSAIKTTVVTFPPSTAPSLSAPMSSDTYESFIVYWSAVSTATSYELQTNFNGGSWSTLLNTSGTNVSRSHNYDGSYGYRVRACNVGGCGPFSSAATVHVADVPGGGPCIEGVCPEPKAVDPAEEEM